MSTRKVRKAPNHTRRAVLWMPAFVLILLALAAALLSGNRRLGVFTGSPNTSVGQWVYLSDLAWDSATTGWLAVANDGLPAMDTSFSGQRITLGGQTYDKGLGTYPLSEITYVLDGRYSLLRSDIGLDDEGATEGAEVKFLVFLDDALVYDSGPVHKGDEVRSVEVPLGRTKTLRLVVQDTGRKFGLGSANWGDARVLLPLVTLASSGTDKIAEAIEAQRKAKEEERVANERRLAEMAQKEMQAITALLGPNWTSSEAAIGSFDTGRNVLVLANSQLAVTLGFGGDKNGYLSIIDVAAGRYVAHDSAAGVTIGPVHLNLHQDTEPVNFNFIEVDEPWLGKGQGLTADYRLRESDTIWTLYLSRFDGNPYLTYQVQLSGGLEDTSPVAFDYFDFDVSNFVVGEQASYYADFSRPRYVPFSDDGLVRWESIGQGKPVFLWSQNPASGVTLAVLDEGERVARFGLQLFPGRVEARLGFEAGVIINQEGSEPRVISPRLFLDVSRSTNLRDLDANFKKVTGGLYPPLPLPKWYKYQWLSWYVYYMDMNEDLIKRQIDYIADNLGDLGHWNIIVDAGWYVSEGRERSDWRNIDEDKFPSGIRDLVDYAHSRGVKVVLYFSTPYLHSGHREGDWLGLKGIIDEHPDWLIPLGQGEENQSFAYDYSNPELRRYVRKVLRDFFVRYDVDGIKIDGLGNAEGAILSPEKLDPFGLVENVIRPTMDSYRFIYENAFKFKGDIYIESGWSTPIFANSYAHTFRYGDESTEFSNNYPFPGLVEHIDYALFQKEVLGQRPNMGAIYGDPNSSDVNRWWLGAALALGVPMTISFDLPTMSDEVMSGYRSLLVQYGAFDGRTYTNDILRPSAVATTARGTTYFGVLNREAGQKTFSFDLAEFGLDGNREYLVYDVINDQYSRAQGNLDATLPGQSFHLFVLRDEPGVMWTNSAFDQVISPSETDLTVRGPASISGFITVASPRPRAVYFDGVLVSGGALGLEEVLYAYDEAAGLVTLRYQHNGPHTIAIRY